MGSIIKMFKPSKKNNNKENTPAVSFASGSLKSKKSTLPTLNESVYDGEPQKIDLRLKSPYSVITKPKTTKGPMSCPGAPLDDRMSFRASMRKIKDDSVLNRRSELVNDQAYRNMMARQQYDMSMSQQDDSDQEKEEIKEKYRIKKGEVAMLKAKIEKMKVAWREEKIMMSNHIDELSNENHQFRKAHDRLRQKYSELKKNNETEKKMKCDILKMLQEANSKIEKLESSSSRLHDDSLNNSSLLIPTYNANTTMEMSSEGAGEALCFPDSQNMNMNSMFMMTSIFGGSTGGSSSKMNPNPQSLVDDMDVEDEVKVFRDSKDDDVRDEEEEDEDMTEDDAEELELSECPFEVETARGSKGKKDSEEIHPDTVSLSVEPNVPKEAKYSRTNSWLKRNCVNPDDDASSDSSEEERLSLIERQLKKKGGLVKYNPPRTKIHDKHYKRFGKNERSALAEFEYLQDMSTDVSGMQSSPEFSQLVGKLQQQRL